MSASSNPERTVLERELEFARALADGLISLDEAAFPWSRVWTVQVTLGRESEETVTVPDDLGQAA